MTEKPKHEHTEWHHHRHDFIFPESFRFSPWYDDRADYHTNAKSYYDYLARYNRLLKEIVELLNRVARRNITVEDTNTVDLTKEGDWIDNGSNAYDDIIALKADVKLSAEKETVKGKALPNAIKKKDDGLYSADTLALINDLYDKVNENTTAISNILPKLSDGQKATMQYSVNVYDGGEDISPAFTITNKTRTLPVDITKYKYIEFFYHDGSTYDSSRYPTTLPSFGITTINTHDTARNKLMISEIHLENSNVNGKTRLTLDFASSIDLGMESGSGLGEFSTSRQKAIGSSFGFGNGTKWGSVDPRVPVIYKIDLVNEVTQ